MGVKPGQRLTDTPKDFLLQVRLSAEEKQELDECVEKLHIDRSKVVRKGIRLVKQLIKE